VSDLLNEARRRLTADDVDGAAGWKWINDRDRPGRVSVLCECGANGKGRCCGGAAGDKMASIHVIPPGDACFTGCPAGLFYCAAMLSPGAVGNQASMIATARVQPAEPPRTLTGKQLTVKPLAGSTSRLCSFSIWQ